MEGFAFCTKPLGCENIGLINAIEKALIKSCRRPMAFVNDTLQSSTLAFLVTPCRKGSLSFQ